MRRSTLWIAAGLVAAAAVAGGYAWQRQSAASRAAAPASGASAPGVSVGTVVTQRRAWPVVLTATGTVTSLNTVDVRPQVASIITRVHIKEGDFVRAGQLLFTLDARNDEASVARARAQLAKDQATLADTERQLARSRELLGQNFISQSAVDTAAANAAGQRAVVAASRAAVETAQVGLGYNRIVAPAAGRAGAINVYAGTTVQPAGTALVTITQLDPISVAFALPQRHLNDALAGLRAGDVPVRARLPDGPTLDGKLGFVDNLVDAASGTVKVKAVFDNPNALLWPGAYVTVRMTVRTLDDAVVVPQAAIVQGATARSVFIVGADGRAVQRAVEVTDAAGDDAVVSGLEPGVKVIVEGRQNVRTGTPVRDRPLAPAAGGAGRKGAGAASGASAAPGPAAAASPGGAGSAAAPQP